MPSQITRVCALVWSAPLLLAGADAISIREAVAEAVQNNPGLKAERMAVAVADAALVTAGLRPNPVLSYSADHLDALGTGFNDVNGAGPPEISLRVDVPWERGGKRSLRLESAGFQGKIVQAKIADSTRKLTLDVILACVDLMEAKAKLALANDNLRSLEGIVTLNTSRVNAGAVAPVELVRSRVAMLQFRGSVKTAELALATARIRLRTLLGRTMGSGVFDISDELKLPLPPIPPDLARIQGLAIASRPDLRAVQLDQARSEADLRLQLAQGKVDYTFGTEYRRQQGINGKGNTLGVFFSTPIPLFNRNQGEIARVSAEQRQLRQSTEALRAQIAGEVAGAFQEYESTRALVAEIERDLLGPSEEARNTTAYVYRAGASSLIDVLDAQRAFNETMSTYYGAQADYRRASSRLASAIGQEVIP